MADSPITDAALEALEDAEFVTEWQEGSNRAKHLTPAELRDLYDLEQKKAADDRRRTSGIYRAVR